MMHYGVYLKDKRNSRLVKYNVAAEGVKEAKEKAIALLIKHTIARNSLVTEEDIEVVRVQNSCGEKVE